jgi:hypothetical protein
MKKGREANEIAGLVVAREGVEPPTPAFSGLYSLSLNLFQSIT